MRSRRLWSPSSGGCARRDGGFHAITAQYARYADATGLHQAVTPGAEFQFVNVARWRTAQDFQAAIQSPGFREKAAGLAGYRPHPALYQVVRT
jgi:hypothetical protein